MGLKVITHNLKGFNSLNKRRKAFCSYKMLGADILLLPETHFPSHNHPRYFEKAFQQGYFTTYESKTQGVAIFIKKRSNV